MERSDKCLTLRRELRIEPDIFNCGLQESNGFIKELSGNSAPTMS